MKNILRQIVLVIAGLFILLPVRAPAQNLFVAAAVNNTIVTFAYTGGVLGTNGAVFASYPGLDGPEGLAFDSGGNLYVASVFNSTIVKFVYTGGVLSTNGAVFASSSSGLYSPYGLAFDSTGNLYAANYLSNTIEKFTDTGGILSSNGTTFIPALSS